MIELKGNFNTAKVFTDEIEESAIKQIDTLLNQQFTKDCKIRIMPDVHSGSGCVVGFTANLGDKVVPNLVGVDIGCGVLTVPLGKVDIDYRRFDKVLRDSIAFGLNINKEIKSDFDELNDLYCYNEAIKYKRDKIIRAIGSLGSGNHFIEIDEDNSDEKYLMIHTGSRHLGIDVCEYYQNIAETNSLDENIPKNLSYLTGSDRDRYLHDMRICQRFAELNRFIIAKELLENYFNDCKINLSSGGSFKLKQKGKYNIKTEWFDTIHNYIGDDNIIRKGSVSAYKDQLLVIPVNMRDGVLICKGKGNEDWNYSAPHGSGRIMSRSKAKESIQLSDYAESMKGIFSTCINENTIDESAFAYKDIYHIIDNVQDTVDIIKIIKPKYNFKAG